MTALDQYNNIKAIVFDFDGTLIDSNEIKHDAFFELFPDEKRFRSVVEEVISDMPETSRYIVLEILLRKTNYIRFGPKLQAKTEQLARTYDNLVTEQAKSCPEIKGATELLNKAFKKYRLYINSNTPIDSLCSIIKFRSWGHYFINIYGYPYGKVAALREIIISTGNQPLEILVVGDGITDQQAAHEVGCRYYAITGEDSLLILSGKLGLPKGESK